MAAFRSIMKQAKINKVWANFETHAVQALSLKLVPDCPYKQYLFAQFSNQLNMYHKYLGSSNLLIINICFLKPQVKLTFLITF